MEESDDALVRLVAHIKLRSLWAFCGAGVSAGAGLPSWGALLKEMTKGFSIPQEMGALMQSNDYPWIAERCRESLNTRQDNGYLDFIREKFGGHRDPSEAAKKIVRLGFRHILTTNYDTVLKNAAGNWEDLVWKPGAYAIRKFIASIATRDDLDRNQNGKIIYIHGWAAEPETVVLTNRDYVARYVLSNETNNLLFAMFATQPHCFIGFSLTDPDLMEILRAVQVFSGVGPAVHYAILASGTLGADGSIKESPEELEALEQAQRLRLRRKYSIEPIFYRASPRHENLDVLLDKIAKLVHGQSSAATLVDHSSPLNTPQSSYLNENTDPSYIEKGVTKPATMCPQCNWWRMEASTQPNSSATLSTPERVEPNKAIKKTPIHEDDPQKGQWGGESKSNDRELSATVKSDNGWFKVVLKVLSTNREKPLRGSVTFHLHDSFPSMHVKVPVSKGEAKIIRRAYGAFTVGAEADDGETRLELDLSQLALAPKRFREN
jgi:hypothetical protein